MALHPFQFFRKRQKSFLAALTILSMFIFILTGFSGSDRIAAWFGFGTGGRGDRTEVTKLNGKVITVGDLDQLRLHRRIADAFMMHALSSQAQPSLASLEPEVQNRLRGILQMMGFGGGFAMARQQLRSYQLELIKGGNDKAATQVAAINRELALEEWRMTHPNDLYFGGNFSPEGLLDFQVWRQQADRLGINLTDDDVRKVINQEAGGDVLTGNPVKDADKVRAFLQGTVRSVDPRDLYAALRDEFRVRLAQEALLGSAGGARAALGTGLAGDQVPAGSTPEQFWEFYKDNRSTLKVDFLKVPVSQFTGEVKEKPSDQELEDLFKRYKNDEPSPERATPGFKVPRKVKVEWAAADPESPHYREASARALPLLAAGQPLALLALPQSLAGSPVGVAGAAAPAALASLWNAPLQLEYETYVKGVKSWWDASNVVAENDNPYATGLRRPDTVAAVLGQVLGAAGTKATPLSAAGTLAGAVEARLAEQRVHQANMVLAGASQFPLAVLAQEAAAANVRVPPLAAVRDEMAARLRDRAAPEMAKAAVDAFVKELEAKRFSPKEAAEYAAKNATLARGITGHGATPQPVDQTEIVDAPGLAPLKRAEEGAVPLNLAGARRFAQELFGLNQVYQPRELRSVSPTHYYYWLTQNDKAYVPTFAEAKPRVEAAWKLNKAREQALEKAKQIAEAVRNRGEGISADRFLRDEAERLKYERFEPTTPIARLVRAQEPTMRASLSTQYEPYKFEESKIPYPRPDTVNELFQALTKPGDATVIWDAPKRNCYVAVLDERKVPTEKEFFDIYNKAPRGFLSDSLWTRFQAEREDRYRADLMRHLREEAQAPLDDQGNYRIDPDVRRHLRGVGGEE